MGRRRYDPTVVLPPRLAERLAAIAAAEQLTLRALVIVAARECARAYPDRFRAGKRLWSRADDRLLRAIYPHQSTASVAQHLRRSIAATNARADKLGLHKTAAYLASPDACRLRRGDNVGAAFRFRKGQLPANKGLRRPGYSVGRGRMQETQFRKGGLPHTHMPVGSTRLVDGYVYRKVTDVRNVPWTVNWKPEHVLLWERVHGPLPAGHCLWFKDGDRRHVDVANLELHTRPENMARNSVHNLPKPLAQAVQLLGALNRTIRRRTRDAEHDRRSA
jgi:hypothetical protein